MDGLKKIFLVVCIAHVSFAYNCIQKSCAVGSCTTASECPANGTNGCEVSSVAGVVSQSCSQTKCVSSWLNVSGSIIAKDCCFTDKCNVESMTSTVDEPNVDQCYGIQCDSEGCLQKAIREKKARLCRRSPNGSCMFSRIDGDQFYESALCVEDTGDVTCVNGANYNFPEGMSMTVHCCKGELCNDGVQEKQPGVEYCYTINCNGTDCIDEAVANNVYTICPQTEFGCMTSYVAGMTSTTCSPLACTAMNLDTVKIECCKGDLCNGPPGSTSDQPNSSVASTTDPTSGADTIGNASFFICSIFSFFFILPSVF
ncbi:uncharacterized protein LOC132753957 [Ruditapes philippinarum]|uniref:uncharacterized protein LOC132753957 n=1 Tax=Ruditapes philippinarum TaxID=129788 RepID=UPI00295B044D|nr:uncharacterized protein LOC132753957 [Ruditapes philippinarum]